MSNIFKNIFSNDRTSYDTCAPYNYPEVDRSAEDVQRYFPATTATGAVVYSMGNFLTNESKEICRHSGILQLKLKKAGLKIAVQESFIPCYVFKKYDASRYAPVPTTRETSVASDKEFLMKADSYIREVMCIDTPADSSD